MKALLIGSIGTLVETSEIQREAFNRAFSLHKLDWYWERSDYQSMLAVSGGAKRVAAFAEGRGESVDAASIHRTKSQVFQSMLNAGEVSVRPGIIESIQYAQESGAAVGLVTTTSSQNLDALLNAIEASLPHDVFGVVMDVDQCVVPKPDPSCYQYALQALAIDSADSVAIEDNVDGVAAAIAAGVTCIAYPGENTSKHDFSHAKAVVDDPLPIVKSLFSQHAVSA